MSIHRAEVDVSGTAAYPSTPQVVIPFEPTQIGVVNEDGSDDVYVSFDGVSDHAHVFGGDGVTVFQRVKQVWLRRGAAGTPPTTVAVIAES